MAPEDIVIEDGDLLMCEARGMAWQKDMSQGRIDYGDAYFDNYVGYEQSPIAEALNAGRCAMLARHLPAGGKVLDFGAGCGTFVRTAIAAGVAAYGFDIIEKTVAHLAGICAYASDVSVFDVVTFWDSLEHLDEPAEVLSRINGVVIVAIPVFDDIRRVRDSKHFKPGEHLWYWTVAGFIDWMSTQGFILLEISDHETQAGRDSIGAFAFNKQGESQ